MVNFSAIYTVVTVLASRVLGQCSTKCYTVMTDQNAPHYPPTTWSTQHTPCTARIVTTITTTVHPTMTSQIVTTPLTTNPPHCPATTFVVKTRTKAAATLRLSTVWTTTNVVKTIIAAPPPGFTPIQSSVPGSTNDTTDVKRSSDSLDKRISSPSFGFAQSYPEKVVCIEYIKEQKCLTTTVTNIETVTASLPSFSKRNLPLACETTVTSTSFSTVTSISTASVAVTTTSTVTNTIAATTINAACLTRNNYINSVSGSPVAAIEAIPTDRISLAVQFDADDDIECCNAALDGTVAGQSLPATHIFIFDQVPDPNDASKLMGKCTLIGSQTCGSSQAAFKYEVLNYQQAVAAGLSPSDPLMFDNAVGGIVVGNARCGEGVGPQ